MFKAPEYQTFDIKTKKCPEKTNYLTSDDLKSAYLESLQNGYANKTTLVTSTPLDKYVDTDIKTGSVKKKENIITAEEIDSEKMTFRSGYQSKSSKNQTSDLDLILKGNRDTHLKIKNRGIFGSSNGANAHNGLSKNSLYYANYLNTDGVGKISR